MNSSTISITWTPPVPTVVRGDSAAGVSQSRRIARMLRDHLATADSPDTTSWRTWPHPHPSVVAVHDGQVLYADERHLSTR
ncbi:hypothetical protein ABZT34_31985 [Streptomyces sp. NPDC005329]|uniref:hypothetical protein n=1 Tax=Streptomyces sp. NPDC005329 TaxID=3157034 RepID=UPI0033B5A42D